MINWINGEPVKVQTGHNFESLILQLNRVQKGTGQLELLDKHEFKYYTYVDYIEFIVPEDIKAMREKNDKISQYFKFEEGDLI